MRISKWMFQSGASEIKLRADLFIDDLRKIVVLNEGKKSLSGNQSMLPGLHGAQSNLGFENILSGSFL